MTVLSSRRRGVRSAPKYSSSRSFNSEPRRDVEIAEAGMRTAMNVPDLSIGEPESTRRSHYSSESRQPRSEMDVLVHRSARLKRLWRGTHNQERQFCSSPLWDQSHCCEDRVSGRSSDWRAKRNRSTASARRFLHSWTIALLSGFFRAEHHCRRQSARS